MTPFRWWYLPSWLGLDAPCVVTTWTWAIAWSTGLPFEPRPALALFLVVWSIYLGDRLFDVARCRDWARATGRLRFGRRYRAIFVACLGACLAGVVALTIVGLSMEVVVRALFVAFGVATHFLVFVVPLVFRDRLPGKEFGVGVFFALGAYACVGGTIEAVPLFVALALVVAFNCLVIAARDADSDRANDPGAASRWWKSMRRDMLWVGTGLTLASGVWAVLVPESMYFVAIALAFASLTILLRFAQSLSGDDVRALADFALFTPWPVIGVSRLNW